MTDPYRNTRQAVQTWHSPSAIDDVVSVPPPPSFAENEPAPQNIQAGLIIVVSANLAVMVVVIGGMLFGGTEPVKAIVSGVIYFTLTSPLYLAIITGVLTAILKNHERETTERQRIGAYRVLGEMAIQWRQAVEINRHDELSQQALPRDFHRRLSQLETESLQRGDPQTLGRGSAFVEPYDNTSRAAHADTMPQVDTTANEAISWLNGLYDDYGNADMGKVGSDGRLKVRMIGSSRGPGSREAGLWLIQKNVINKVPGGFALNLRHFRTREAVRNLL